MRWHINTGKALPRIRLHYCPEFATQDQNDHAARLDKINVVPLPGTDSTAILY
jgi:hypothetical protein